MNPLLLVDDRIAALDKLTAQYRQEGFSVVPILFHATRRDGVSPRLALREEKGDVAIVYSPKELESLVAKLSAHAGGLLTDYDFDPSAYTGAKLAQAVMNDPARFHGLRVAVHSGQGGAVIPDGGDRLKTMPAMLHGLGHVPADIPIVMKQDRMAPQWVAQQLGITLQERGLEI